MIILMGKTCSGKDTIARELEKRGYVRHRTYTTRLRRPGEPDDAYNFVSEPVFLDMIGHDEFMEYKVYHTAFGDWYYGSVWPGVNHSDNKNFMILTPQGYIDCRDKLPDGSVCVFVYADLYTIRKRLKERGDDEDEAERRIIHDNDDFKNATFLADIVIDNSAGRSVDEVVDTLEKSYRLNN